MKPEWCDEKTWETADYLFRCSSADVIALALRKAHQRGRLEGMEEAAKAGADWLDEAATEVEDWGAYAGAYFQEKHDLEGCVQEIRERASFIRAKAQEVWENSEPE